MKPLMLKFQILIDKNDFRIDILFYDISVKFSEKKYNELFLKEIY